MRIQFAILTTVTLLAFAACSRSKEGDNYTHVDRQDAGMNAAIEKAKATAGDFVLAFQAKTPGSKDFFAKKPYPTPTGDKEHMWIEVFEEENGMLKGRIANAAEETREVKMGQIVSFKLSEISDWKYQDGKKLIGGYTIRYFIEKMSPKERDAFLKEAGFEL